MKDFIYSITAALIASGILFPCVCYFPFALIEGAWNPAHWGDPVKMWLIVIYSALFFFCLFRILGNEKTRLQELRGELLSTYEKQLDALAAIVLDSDIKLSDFMVKRIAETLYTIKLSNMYSKLAPYDKDTYKELVNHLKTQYQIQASVLNLL